MPMVRAYVHKDFKGPIEELWHLCEEIIPAGMNSKEGPLTPGSIEFIHTVVDFGLSVDVVIDIEAYYYADRAANIEERAEDMKLYFNMLLPTVTFAVFPKLVTAGWASDSIDPTFDGDMSLKAAYVRARTEMTYRRATVPFGKPEEEYQPLPHLG